MAKDDEIFDLDNLDKGIGKITNLITRLNEADAELVNLSKNALAASKALGGISTPGGLGKTQGDNAKTLAELDKLKKKYAELEASIVKLNNARKQSEKLSLQEKVDARIRLQNDTAQAKAVSNEADAYQKLAAQLAAAQKNAQAIGATWGSDSLQFKKASDAVRKLDDEIKKIDAGIGKHQRNVGNYAGGWNALGNSVNQITREAPAAAVSMNTFFLAISNNLPALFDAVSAINAENKKLAAEGQKTTSIWKQLGSSVFSFQTLLSVGVTLLTLYGGKLIEMALGLGNVEAQLKKVELQQSRYNRQLEDANRNIEHNLKLEKNRRLVAGESTKDLADLDKKAALEKLKNFESTRDANKKLLDLEIKRISDKKGLGLVNFVEEINILEKLTAEKLRLEKKLGKELVKNTYLARTEQQKSDVELLAKTNNKLNVLETLSQDEIYQKRKEGYIKSNNEAVLYGQQVSELFSDLTVQQSEKEDDRLANLAEMNKKEIELLIAKNDILLNDEDAYYSDRFKALDDDFRLRKRLAELDRDEELRLAKNSYEKRQTALLEFQIKQIELLQSHAKKRADLEKLDLDPITELLNTDFRKDLLKPVQDSAKKAGKELEEAGKKADKLNASISKLQASTKQWLSSFGADFLQNSGFGSLNTFFDDTFKNLLKGAETSQEKFAVYFNSIAEVAQDAYNFISNASQQNFESEKNRLQKQYDVAVGFAGDSAEAKKKLDEDLEKKQKEIANREAKAKKQQALFNIAVDTAQAVVAALPNFVLAGIVAAIGIAQAIAVNSQEIPQYWMGGTHDGGLMMVNDGAGSNYRETIVTPDGKIIQPTGRNVIMDAPAGTEIFTHDQWQNTLSDMLKGKGIEMHRPNSGGSGLSKSDMREVLMDTIGNQSQSLINFDENGITQSFINKGNKTTAYTKRGNSTKLRFG